MVGICQCHIPTPIHYDIFPPGGNMTGGNLLGNQNDHNDDDDDYDKYDENYDGSPSYLSRAAQMIFILTFPAAREDYRLL